MILNVSGRCDIVAFYSNWFMKRYQEGFVDVRNPFYPQKISRIYFDDVDAILFCTKNPIPILNDLKKIKKPILFHVTLTPYHKEIEPNVISKTKIIEAIKEISRQIGADNLWVRYDPVFLSQKYDIAYHKRAFDKMCCLLDGYVKTIIISFLDEYKNVRKNRHVLNYRSFQEEDYEVLGRSFSKSAKEHKMTVQTCFEKRTLEEYGFVVGECLSHEFATKITGKKYPNWKARNCKCVQMVDIGVYNSCEHRCKYCYANYDEKQIADNTVKHDKNSSLLIGSIMENDIIKIRKK